MWPFEKRVGEGYLNNVPVLRNAKSIGINWIIEERLGNLMLHHLVEYLLQGRSQR